MSKSLDAKDVVVVREPGTPDNNILDGGDSPNGRSVGLLCAGACGAGGAPGGCGSRPLEAVQPTRIPAAVNTMPSRPHTSMVRRCGRG